jgi:hypothetical protein
VAVMGMQTSALPFGARQIQTLLPGTSVYVLVHPQLRHGVIVGVEPDHSTDPTLAQSDFIHQASRCGLRVDRIHSAVLRLNKKGGAVDWSAGRPFDGTTAGEWGAIAETGVKVTVDSFMAQLGVDELTGVAAFYHDQLLRIGGYNFQRYTSGTELEILHDEGEIYVYDGETPYPWEQRGVLSPGSDPYRERGYRQTQIDEPHYAALEPQSDDQMPFHRVLRLGGYLGQGGKELILIPPAGAATLRYGGGADPIAVSEVQRTLSGRYLIRAAKGFHIAKQISIPAPRRKSRAEDSAGDSSDNYKFAGNSGGGEAHQIVGSVEPSDDQENPHLQQAAAIQDVRAFAYNWEGEHALHYHKNDWSVNDEGDTEFGTNQEPVDFGTLADEFYLPRPEPRTANVDHRYGEVDYFPNASHFDMTDDGAVVLSDGYGAEIRLVAGHIVLSAPGDIWFKSGRNLVQWAGNDWIARAKNSWDLSATKGDGRAKAERNFQVLGGNDGPDGNQGGVLIESRAPAAYDYADKVGEDVVTGGVQVKCRKGDVALWARNIYVRTGGGDVEPGVITLDADRGKREIVTHSRDFTRYVTNVCADNFGTDGDVRVANLYSANSALIDTSLIVGDSVAVLKGGMLISGYVSVVDGHIATEFAPDFNNLVPRQRDEDLEKAHAYIEEANSNSDEVQDNAAEFFRALFTDFWYAEGQPGADETIEAVGFSFRNTKQYRSEKFKLWEDRWQQFARLAGAEPAKWTESPVQAGSEVTYPYPGKEKWKDEETLQTQDLELYDQEEGVAKDRDPSIYGEPKFKAPEQKVPDGNYAVLI